MIGFISGGHIDSCLPPRLFYWEELHRGLRAMNGMDNTYEENKKGN